MKITLFICVGVVFYAYIGYPLTLMFLRLIVKRPVRRAFFEPAVTLIVPAFNEARIIEEKIRNCAALVYPKDKLEVIVASDGSTDATVELSRRAGHGASVRILAFDFNRGKMAVLNDAVRTATGDIILFSDAASMLAPDALGELLANFADLSVAGVSGLYRVRGASRQKLGKQEEIYWRYETFLKSQESSLDSVLGGHGAILAVRKSLYPFPSEETINDDYTIVLRLIAGGHRVVYEPRAIAYEEAFEMAGFKRRVRIMAGNLQQLKELRGLLWPPRVLPLFFFLSHKVLRIVVPFLLLVLAFTTVLSLGTQEGRWLAILQLAFYLLAFAGLQWELKPRLLRLPYYFCFVNTAYFWGAMQALQSAKVNWK